MSAVQKVIDIATREVGVHEKKVGGHWVNDSKYNRWFGKIPGYGQDGYGWPWCAAFVAWVAHEAGVSNLYPKTASCSAGVNWWKKLGRWSEYPAIGAQVFFGPGGGTHTGLVVGYDADNIYTVEGNTNVNGSAEGDGVYKRTRARRSANVYGYGYPKFPEGIKSADPAYAKEAPKAPAKPAPAKPKPAPAKPKPAPKPAPKPNPIYRLSDAVKPGATHVQVADIQQLLIKLGYKIPGAVTNFYGKNTEAAVALWHERNPKYKNIGLRRDTRIGPAGYIALQKQCGRR
ncbi:endolysin [Streptomyces phage Vanseggelen]|uniref:Endolysin n=1 Tax=Streptomyces phage Vanseggelen TaxID=3065246 RepID=A0AA50F148_9CAUD|nr:endolysin [Streptomyces phage Vanseggelen]